MRWYLALASLVLAGITSRGICAAVEVQFEDIAAGTTFPNGSLPTSFVTEGVTVFLSAFGGSGSANGSIATGNNAGGTGNEMWLFADLRAELDIGAGASEGFFYYGDFGGTNRLEVNGATIDFGTLSGMGAGTVGGVDFTWSPLSGSANSVKLDGSIQTIAFIGQELAVDRISLVVVPEPTSLALLVLGIAALAGRRLVNGFRVRSR